DSALSRQAQDELGGRGVLGDVAAGLVDRDLRGGGSAGMLAEEDLSELDCSGRVEAGELVAPGGGWGEGGPGLDDQAGSGGEVWVELSSWWRVPDGGDMGAGCDRVGEQDRRGGSGAEADHVRVAGLGDHAAEPVRQPRGRLAIAG